MATGVLPLVIGRATRLAQFLTASDKTYEATIAFGRTTDTYDASGKIVDDVAIGGRRATSSTRRSTSSAARSSRRRRRFPRRTSTASARTICARTAARSSVGTTRPKAVPVTVQAPRDPVVRRRDGAARDAGHRGLLRALARARSRRGARVRRASCRRCGARGPASSGSTARSRWPTCCRRPRESLAGAAGARSGDCCRTCRR